MKLTSLFAVLLTLSTTTAFAGGSSYNCRSSDGSIHFGGNDGGVVEISQEFSEPAKSASGRDLGVTVGYMTNLSVKIEKGPEFAEPQPGYSNSAEALGAFRQSMRTNNQMPTSETRVMAIGAPTLLDGQVETPGREIGSFVFTQRFAVIELVHTPNHVHPNGTHYRSTVVVKTFACQSSYATSCGGGCTAE